MNTQQKQAIKTALLMDECLEHIDLDNMSEEVTDRALAIRDAMDAFVAVCQKEDSHA